jgi:U3 small nucleolar RNA-associated protein MPP10
MTTAEKKAARLKGRKEKKRARDALNVAVDKQAKLSRKRQKEAALKSVVKKGKGVTVVGKESKTKPSGKTAVTK